MCLSTSAETLQRRRRKLSVRVKSVARPRARVGSLRPEIGSSGRNTPNSTMKPRPHRKSGTERMKPVTASMATSPARPAKRVPTTASAPPSSTAIVVASATSSSVAGRREAIRPATSCRVVIEMPKLPLRACPAQMTNCCHSGLSRPYRACRRATTASSAPGGIIIATGSPGTTRTSTNTSTATPARVGTAWRMRSRMRRGSMAQMEVHPPPDGEGGSRGLTPG